MRQRQASGLLSATQATRPIGIATGTNRAETRAADGRASPPPAARDAAAGQGQHRGIDERTEDRWVGVFHAKMRNRGSPQRVSRSRQRRDVDAGENDDKRGRGELDPDHRLAIPMLPFRRLNCRSGCSVSAKHVASHIVLVLTSDEVPGSRANTSRRTPRLLNQRQSNNDDGAARLPPVGFNRSAVTLYDL